MSANFAIAVLLAAAGIAAGLVFGLRRRLLQEAAARRLAETRLDTLLEHAPVAMAVVRPDGRIEHLNLACRQLFGYGPEDLRCIDDWWPKAHPDPAYRAMAIDTTRRMAASPDAHQSGSDPRELKVTCRDGTVKDIEFQYRHLGNVGLWTMIDHTDHHRVAEAARLANDYLLAQLGENSRLHEALREQAIRDPLTTLFNRRYLDETLEREISRAVREGYPIAVMMLDIDHFKRLNDSHGHLAGDEMLKATARLLSANARMEDVVCRFGGEEFAIVLPKMPLETARLRADEWRQNFAAATVVYEGVELKATLSAGVAAFPEHGQTRDGLIAAADEALYRAKQNGRNRIELATLPATACAT